MEKIGVDQLVDEIRTVVVQHVESNLSTAIAGLDASERAQWDALSSKIVDVFEGVEEECPQKMEMMRTQSDNADKAEYFLDIVTSRFSCKKFNGQKVSNEILSKLLEATTHAPTSFNTQPYQCKVVMSDEAKAKLKGALMGANAERLDNAAGALVWGADLKVEVAEGIRSYVDTFIGQCSCPQAWAYKQTSMACATFCLAAQAHGVNTSCMEGFESMEAVRDSVGLSDRYAVPMVIMFGYADGDGGKASDERRRRRTTDDVFQTL